MIDGLGVAGWGVGGIEAEAAMLGQVKDLLLYLHLMSTIWNESLIDVNVFAIP
jgi:hypothetical protein